jgi:hypothetical protein
MPIFSRRVGRVSPQHCVCLSSESSFFPRCLDAPAKAARKTLDGKTLVVAEGHTALSFVSVANALAGHAECMRNVGVHAQ